MSVKIFVVLVTQYWKSLENFEQFSGEFSKFLTATIGFVKTVCSSVPTEYCAPRDAVSWNGIMCCEFLLKSVDNGSFPKIKKSNQQFTSMPTHLWQGLVEYQNTFNATFLLNCADCTIKMRSHNFFIMSARFGKISFATRFPKMRNYAANHL
jgi:hypothetical protein